MIKILLSLTIWLRKYQGRGGNYYTISNASTILIIFMLLFLFLIRDFLYSILSFRIEKDIVGIAILIFSIVYVTIIPFYLMGKLRKRNIYLHFKQYKQNLYSAILFGILLSVLLLIMQFLKKGQ